MKVQQINHPNPGEPGAIVDMQDVGLSVTEAMAAAPAAAEESLYGMAFLEITPDRMPIRIGEWTRKIDLSAKPKEVRADGSPITLAPAVVERNVDWLPCDAMKLMTVVRDEMSVINLTPHDVILLANDGKTIMATWPSIGAARVAEINEDTDIGGWPAVAKEYGGIEGLPGQPEPNTIYLVALPVLMALRAQFQAIRENLAADPGGKSWRSQQIPEERGDLLRALAKWLEHVACPDTGPDSVVRDDKGRILGVRRLQIAPKWRALGGEGEMGKGDLGATMAR